MPHVIDFDGLERNLFVLQHVAYGSPQFCDTIKLTRDCYGGDYEWWEYTGLLNTYSAKNAHDLSYETAWVEGVSGYGIGEYIEYHVKPENPRITEIIIVNGYVKSDNTWKNNSRVKKMNMYIDNKLYAILELEDSKAEQHFKVDPIGYGDRSNFEFLKKKPGFTMKFEILEVYPGLKWDDTAITEIYFDGIDVH